MENELNRLLAGFPVFCTLPIQWGDQDSFAHVNNTVYFRWIESSRIEYGNRLGFAEMMERSRISPILAATSCNYRRQLIYPDTVDVGTRITKIGRTSMVMEHRIVSRNLRAVAAEGESTLVLFDYGAQHPVEVSAALRKSITELEGPGSPLVQLNSPAG